MRVAARLRAFGAELVAAVWLVGVLAVIITVVMAWWWAMFIVSVLLAVVPLLPSVLFASAGPLLTADVWAIRAVYRRGGLPHGAVEVDRREALWLWEEIDELAKKLGTNAPVRLYLIPEANALVLERRRAGARRQERVLCVGFPLLVSLSQLQRRAILAHEIGHFAERHAPFTRLADRSVRMLQMLQTEMDQRTLPQSDFRAVNALMRELASIQHGLFSLLVEFHQAATRPVRHGNELAADRAAARVVGPAAMRDALAGAEATSACWREFHASMAAAPPGRRVRAEELFDAFNSQMPALRRSVQPAAVPAAHPLVCARLTALTQLCSEDEPDPLPATAAAPETGTDVRWYGLARVATGVAKRVLAGLAENDRTSMRTPLSTSHDPIEEQKLLMIGRSIKRARIAGGQETPFGNPPRVGDAVEFLARSRGPAPEAHALTRIAAEHLPVDRWPRPLAYALAGGRPHSEWLHILTEAAAAPRPEQARALLGDLNARAHLHQPFEAGADVGRGPARRWVRGLAATGLALCMALVLATRAPWPTPTLALLLLGILTAPVCAMVWAVADPTPDSPERRSHLVRAWFRAPVGVLIVFVAISYALRNLNGIPLTLIVLAIAFPVLNPTNTGPSNKWIIGVNVLATVLMVGYSQPQV